jgi:cobalamin biosynthesis Mg chelatase CobN
MKNPFVQDTNAQSTPRSAIILIVTIAVGIIVASVLIPVAIDEIEGDTTTTFTQDTSTTYEVNGELNSTVTATTDGSDATVELNDTRTAGTTSNTINVGSTTTYSLQGGDVNVTVDSATSSGATVTYEYAKDYAYSDGASSLWGILGLAIVLGVMLYVISLATDRV